MNPLLITVTPATSPMDVTDDDTLELELAIPDDIDVEELRADLVSMLGVTDGFIIEERRTTTEWGASGDGIEFAVTVISTAWEAIVGGAAWAALQRMVKHREREPARADTDEEAQMHAKQRVATRYYDQVELSDLQVIETMTETGHDGSNSRVVLRGPSGETYTVTTRSNGTTSMTRTMKTQFTD